MKFYQLYSLLVEKDDEYVPGDKSDSSDDKAGEKFAKDADKIAKDQSAADVKSDNDDPFAKLGAGAGDKLANKLFGAKHTPVAAAKALEIAASRKIAAANIPSWVWTQSINDSSLHGQDRVNAKEKLKDEYTKSLADGDDSEKPAGDEPEEKPDDVPADDAPADDAPADEPSPEEKEKAADDENEDRETEKAEREAEKDQKIADKEEEADSEKKDKAKDVKLKA